MSSPAGSNSICPLKFLQTCFMTLIHSYGCLFIGYSELWNKLDHLAFFFWGVALAAFIPTHSCLNGVGRCLGLKWVYKKRAMSLETFLLSILSGPYPILALNGSTVLSIFEWSNCSKNLSICLDHHQPQCYPFFPHLVTAPSLSLPSCFFLSHNIVPSHMVHST